MNGERRVMNERLGLRGAIVAIGLIATGVACTDFDTSARNQLPVSTTLSPDIQSAVDKLNDYVDELMAESLAGICDVRVSAADCDIDGIANGADRRPYISDPVDVDDDGIFNFKDLQPYAVSKPPAASITATQYNKILSDKITVSLVTRQSLLTKDSDNDRVPDYLDRYYGDDYGDADRDGLKNADDPAPTNPDRDNDGSPDGYDPAPNNPNIGRLADKRQEQKLIDKKYEENRQADKLQQQRDEQRRQEEKRALEKQQARMDEERRLRERER